MIEIRIFSTVGQEDLRKRIVCLFCGKKIEFFYKNDPFCPICGQALPDLAGMCQEEEKRVEYHRTGKTTGEPSYFWDRQY